MAVGTRKVSGQGQTVQTEGSTLGVRTPPYKPSACALPHVQSTHNSHAYGLCLGFFCYYPPHRGVHAPPHMYSAAQESRLWLPPEPYTHIIRPAGQRLQPRSAVFNFDCTSCNQRCPPEPSPRQGICARCISTSQARAGQVTTQLEPFLCIMLQSAVKSVRELPVAGLSSAATRRRWITACSTRCTACSSASCQSRVQAKESLWTSPGCHHKLPACKANTQSGASTSPLPKWSRRSCVGALVDSLGSDAIDAGWPCARRPHHPLGPVFHMPQGAIGCIATLVGQILVLFASAGSRPVTCSIVI